MQTAHEVKYGKIQGKNGSVREFLALVEPKAEPARAQLEAAVQLQFKMALGRSASADEVGRFLALYDRCLTAGDRPGAARTMLQAVLLKTDALLCYPSLGLGRSMSCLLRVIIIRASSTAGSLSSGR